MSFDIVIITYNRETLLKKCLKSILEKELLELRKIILINNGGEPLRFSIPKNVDYYEIEKSYPAQARNFAVKKCSSNWILFLDDDVIVPDHYFDISKNVFSEIKDLDVLGGPDQNYPKVNSTQRALGMVLKSPIATGHTRHRHMINQTQYLEGDESNLILCHLWVRKDIFDEGFWFPENYFRNEENIFLERLKKSQKKILHKPELFIFHYRKDSLKNLFKVTFISALYRKKSLLESESDFNIFFFFPSFFILYLILLPYFPKPFIMLPLIVYILLSFLFLFPVKEAFSLKIYGLGIQVLVHLAYGVGFLCPETIARKMIRY